MSHEINITTNTNRSVIEIADWMITFPFQNSWKLESEPTSADGAVVQHDTDDGLYRCVVSRPRQTGPFHRSWFASKATVCIDTKVRRASLIGRCDTVFAVAFELCKLDAVCDVLLLDNGEEVFVRQKGELFITPEYFRARSLGIMLPDKYKMVRGRLCDVPGEDRQDMPNYPRVYAVG